MILFKNSKIHSKYLTYSSIINWKFFEGFYTENTITGIDLTINEKLKYFGYRIPEPADKVHSDSYLWKQYYQLVFIPTEHGLTRALQAGGQTFLQPLSPKEHLKELFMN